jgi:hypothetical protein
LKKIITQTPLKEEEETNKILMFMEEEKPKIKEQSRSEFKEPRVMESAIEKIQKAKKSENPR